MKKLLLAAIVASSLVACNETKTDETVVTDSTTVTSTQTAPEPVDGEYMMRENQVYVRQTGEWVVVNEPVTLPNGTIVMANGQVKSNDGVTVTLAEGQRVNNSGVVVDANGDNIFDDAADGVKKGVNEAGQAIEKGANKTGDAIKKGANEVKEGVNKVVN